MRVTELFADKVVGVFDAVPFIGEPEIKIIALEVPCNRAVWGKAREWSRTLKGDYGAVGQLLAEAAGENLERVIVAGVRERFGPGVVRVVRADESGAGLKPRKIISVRIRFYLDS